MWQLFCLREKLHMSRVNNSQKPRLMNPLLKSARLYTHTITAGYESFLKRISTHESRSILIRSSNVSVQTMRIRSSKRVCLFRQYEALQRSVLAPKLVRKMRSTHIENKEFKWLGLYKNFTISSMDD